MLYKEDLQKCGDILKISDFISKLLWFCGWLCKVLDPGNSGLHKGVLEKVLLSLQRIGAM